MTMIKSQEILNLVEVVSKGQTKYEFKDFLNKLNASCSEQIEGYDDLDGGKRCSVACSLYLTKDRQSEDIQKFITSSSDTLFEKFDDSLRRLLGNPEIKYGSLYEKFIYDKYKSILSVQTAGLASSNVLLSFSFSIKLLKDINTVDSLLPVLSKMFEKFGELVNDARSLVHRLDDQTVKLWISGFCHDVKRASGVNPEYSSSKSIFSFSKDVAILTTTKDELEFVSSGKYFDSFINILKSKRDAQWKELESFMGTKFIQSFICQEEGLEQIDFEIYNSILKIRLFYLQTVDHSTSNYTCRIAVQVVPDDRANQKLFFTHDKPYSDLVSAISTILSGFVMLVNKSNQEISHNLGVW